MLDMPSVTFTSPNKYQIQILKQEICPDTFDDSQMPSDMHIITYKVNDEIIYDAVRAYKKVDIFDAYYDKLKGLGDIISIKSGYGRIKPKLYNPHKEDNVDE